MFLLLQTIAAMRGSLYCTKVGSRRQKRFRSLYSRAQSVTEVTETIAVRKYSMQWRVFPIRRGSPARLALRQSRRSSIILPAATAGPDEIIGLVSAGYRRSLGRQNLQPRLFYPALIAYIESCYLRLSFTRRGGPNTMNESNTALYDEDVLHGDKVPDAALELAGSKLWEGLAASFTLAFCSGLDTCPTSPRE